MVAPVQAYGGTYSGLPRAPTRLGETHSPEEALGFGLDVADRFLALPRRVLRLVRLDGLLPGPRAAPPPPSAQARDLEDKRLHALGHVRGLDTALELCDEQLEPLRQRVQDVDNVAQRAAAEQDRTTVARCLEDLEMLRMQQQVIETRRHELRQVHTQLLCRAHKLQHVGALEDALEALEKLDMFAEPEYERHARIAEQNALSEPALRAANLGQEAAVDAYVAQHTRHLQADTTRALPPAELPARQAGVAEPEVMIN